MMRLRSVAELELSAFKINIMGEKARSLSFVSLRALSQQKSQPVGPILLKGLKARAAH